MGPPPTSKGKDKAPRTYISDLRAEVETKIDTKPNVKMHAVEWFKVLNGDPVEINPSKGNGRRIMTIDEWAERWKRNDDLPDCLACGSLTTKEHYFKQRWCRGKCTWESDVLCMTCNMYSFRKYSDPDFMTPEDYEKVEWEKRISEAQAATAGIAIS